MIQLRILYKNPSPSSQKDEKEFLALINKELA